MTAREAIAESVAATGWMISNAGLVESFGHVSTRWEKGFAITSVRPFDTSDHEDVVFVEDLGDPPSGDGVAPIETPMHASIYAARSDVGAICRGHPPSVVAWGTGTDELPLFHGLGALAGAQVRVHPDIDLIATAEQAAGVAATLADDDSVILRANGCLAVGSDLIEAATRLYYLEERARVALHARVNAAGGWDDRLRHVPAEMARAQAWMQARYGRKLEI